MSNSSISVSTPLISPASGRAALAGAGGGLLSYFVGEIVGNFVDAGGQGASGPLDVLLSSALWSGAIGLVLGAAILIYDNFQSLRGQWHRDVLGGLPLFFGLSFLGGAAGQLAYSVVQNSLTRGIGWALMGAGVGVGVGILRRDKTQALRGALGGGIGGFLGGFIFDGLALISTAGNGSFSRLAGQILMGALIALLMRVVQDALKSAWLLGVSTGPYEGKEYPLNTARVSVGRAPSNDISLFREETVPAQLGALVFQGGNWHWQGNAVDINGAMQSAACLENGDTLQLGATRFRFKTRSGQSAPLTPQASSAPHPEVLAAPSAAPLIPAASPEASPGWALETTNGQLLRVPNSRGPISIGRTAQNSLVLADEGVSSRHATLQMSGEKLMICDLDSTNGTFVNSAKIAPHSPQPLQIGDRVRFGNFETTLRAG